MSSTSRSRSRSRGGFHLESAYRDQYNHAGNFVGRETTTATVGEFETMDDVVTRPFVPGRTFVNNPMLKTHTTKQRTPCSGDQTLKQNPGYQGTTYVSGQRYYDRSTDLAVLYARLSNLDTSPLVSEAATSALAGVKRPEVSGMVSIAELKETVHSLLNPVNGALNFLKRNALGYRKGSRKSRRNLKASASNIADQHLTIVFGLMPFISDVQGTLKVLRERAESQETQLYTSRGTASIHDRQTASGEKSVYNDGTNIVYLQYNDEVIRTVTARAYLLYRTRISIADSLGLSPDEIPRAIWQTATLSFVVDWFANVGNYISALTPRIGTEVVSSGYSIQTVDVLSSSYSTRTVHSGSIGWSGSDSGGKHVDLILSKSRVPSSLRDHIGLHFKHNMHKDVLDTFKVTAAISLLTQRLQKFL